MKSKTRLRVISTLLLACLCLQAIPAQCAEIFFNYTTANRLYVDMEFTKKDLVDKGDRLNLCVKGRQLLERQVALTEIKVNGLQEDKKAYREEADAFQSLYVKADQARVKATTAAPSRLRWFVTGALTAVIAGIAAAFALR